MTKPSVSKEKIMALLDTEIARSKRRMEAYKNFGWKAKASDCEAELDILESNRAIVAKDQSKVSKKWLETWADRFWMRGLTRRGLAEELVDMLREVGVEVEEDESPPAPPGKGE